MFDVGFSELVVIGAIALIVLGPKRLPEVARTAGKWMARLRRFVSEVKQDFDREMHHEELAELRKLKQELDSTRNVMQNTSSELLKGFTEIAPDAASSTSDPNKPQKLTDAASAQTATAPRAKKSRPGRKNGGTRRKQLH